MSTAITPALIQYEPSSGELVIHQMPDEVLAQAQQAAKALMSVVNSKPDKLTFNNKTYLALEDWQTVGRFYGVTARIESASFVQFGDVKGFEAVAVAIDASGRVLSRAESMCLDDEEKWGARPKYQWVDVLDAQGKKIWEFNAAKGKQLPKREKVQIGVESTPLFQLRSMAQTRACSKVFRNVLAWVVVLAGYSGTPAEEMPTQVNDPEYMAEPAAPSATPTPAAPANTFIYENGTLFCTPLNVEERKSKKGEVFLAVKMNGQIEGQYVAFCWHASLFDAIRKALNKPSKFVLTKTGQYFNLDEVLFIEGVRYSEGQPAPIAPNNPLEITDDDIPF